ncbi:MAG: rhomboid family intramembrane serine protease [Planctomycetaceae bacterium]|jgi:membrane associated rhomboid family serine protease|nr:rhomboid family intramembrane serine protease [Planctomycetaceae bacterium]
MGFQDRDYNRSEPYDDNGYYRSRRGSVSITMRLVFINFVLWLANGFLFADSHFLMAVMAIVPGTLKDPELWWKFLTYGFAHSPTDFWHIGGNMLGLVMFGYGMMLGIGQGGFGLVRGENIEDRLGRTEYLAFYLLTIVFSGIVYAALTDAGCLGASGGVTGIVILYALFYPTKTLLFWGILPLPMWAIGILIVFMDAQGASGIGTGGIAYVAHLAGAGFALFYYYFFAQHHRKITNGLTGWGKFFRKKFKPKPKLHLYPEDNSTQNPTKQGKKSEKEEEFEKRLDEILGRYGRVGEAGLTKEERDFLQRASKKYRDKEK